MGEIDYILSADSGKNLSCCLVKDGLAAIKMRLEPLAFRNPPESLGNVEMWAVGRQEKEVESPLFPYISHLCNLSFPMNGGVVKNNKCGFDNFLGKIIKIIRQQLIV